MTTFNSATVFDFRKPILCLAISNSNSSNDNNTTANPPSLLSKNTVADNKQRNNNPTFQLAAIAHQSSSSSKSSSLLQNNSSPEVKLLKLKCKESYLLSSNDNNSLNVTDVCGYNFNSSTSSQFKTTTTSYNGSIITDLKFNYPNFDKNIKDCELNPKDSDKLAISFSTGSISVLSIANDQIKNENNSSSSLSNDILNKIWDSGKYCNGTNKLNWHPSERDIIGTANQDGLVRLFDTRLASTNQTVKVQCITFINENKSHSHGGSSSRDICFDPFHSHVFAEVSDSGSLRIWDRRYPNKPLVIKQRAHLGQINAVSFSPYDEWMVATASKDKTVKLWDVNDSSSTSFCTPTKPSHSYSYSSNESIASGRSSPDFETVVVVENLKHIATLHTSSEVSKIKWISKSNYNNNDYQNNLNNPNKASNNNDNKLCGLLATVSSSDNGNILLWDFDYCNIPICIMRGSNSQPDLCNNATSTCIDFSILDSIRIFKDCKYNIEPTVEISSKVNNKSNKDKGTKASTKKGALNNNSNNTKVNISKQQIEETSKMKLLINKRIMITAMKDGKLSLQDMNNCYYPHKYISSAVTAISSQGHVAFHRGNNFLLKESKNESNRSENDVISNRDALVYIGLADILNLKEAYDIRKVGGAEAGVFDPALINLLAKSYCLAHDNVNVRDDMRNNTTTITNAYSHALTHEKNVKISEYQVAINACKSNNKIANAAGLYCREAMWTSLISLIPSPDFNNNNNDNNNSNSNKSQNLMHLPFENLANDTISYLLLELLNGGDSQHFVVVSEILKKTNILNSLCQKSDIPAVRVRQAYLAYIDLLTKLQLFCEANEIIKASDDTYISSLSKQGVEIHTKCSRCNKELMKTSGAWCLKCTRYAAICSFCNMPVKGLFHWCPVCSHGGHLKCTELWFKQSNSCPSGCGHDCCSTLVSNVSIDGKTNLINNSKTNLGNTIKCQRVNFRAKILEEKRIRIKNKLSRGDKIS